MHNSLKEKVLESVDIVDVVAERVSLTRKGREYVGLCPFHDDHSPSLSVSPQKQIFKCWSCGAGGDVIKFVQLSQRVDFREALATLARRAGIEVRASSGRDQSAALREQIRQTLTWACSYFQRNLQATPGGKRAAAYARGRGVTDATMERWRLGYAADSWDDLLTNARRAGISEEILLQAGLVSKSEAGKVYDRFRDRLIFPICDGLGRCIAFGGRTLGNDSAKYLNSPETPLFNKSRVLYGLDLARDKIAAAREVVVVEGYLDVVLLSQAGVANVVAALGTSLTDAHVKLIKPLSDAVVMCFDSDEAGLRAADRAVEVALRHRIEVRVVVMPEGQDPADYVIGKGSQAFEGLLQSAIEALEFKWKRTVQAFSERGRQRQRDAVEAFLKFVARVSAAGGISLLDQGLLVGRLSELLSIPAGTVYELLTKAKAGVEREAPLRTPDISELSAYDASIRGLPIGMVSAAEELFGLALMLPEYFGEFAKPLAEAACYCKPWSCLHELLLRLAEQAGGYTKAAVIAHCDDGLLCDLVGRACGRVASEPVDAEKRRSVIERISKEIELLRIEGLRAELREKSGNEQDREQAYRSLLDTARRQHSVLGTEQRLGAPQ